MKNTLFIFFLLWVATAFTQVEKFKIKKTEEKKETPKDKKKEDYRPVMSVDIIYGQKIYAKNFFKQLNTFDSLNFDSPVKFIGFGFSSHYLAFNPRGSTAMVMSFNFIIPQAIKINDTVKAQLKGFAYNLGLGKALQGSKRILTLGMFLGFNTGFTKCVSTVSGKQVNPFFSPKIALQPRLEIKRFTFSVLFDCEYDVSNPEWKSFKSSDQSKSLQGFNQTCISLIGTLGYGFH